MDVVDNDMSASEFTNKTSNTKAGTNVTIRKIDVILYPHNVLEPPLIAGNTISIRHSIRITK